MSRVSFWKKKPLSECDLFLFWFSHTSTTILIFFFHLYSFHFNYFWIKVNIFFLSACRNVFSHYGLVKVWFLQRLFFLFAFLHAVCVCPKKLHVYWAGRFYGCVLVYVVNKGKTNYTTGMFVIESLQLIRNAFSLVNAFLSTKTIQVWTAVGFFFL